MASATWDETDQPYDGCGKSLLGVRRLPRMRATTSSPERQRADVLTAAEAVGGHIIGWADDWEVSGATDPMTRPKLGPWLRDERALYDGLVAARLAVRRPRLRRLPRPGPRPRHRVGHCSPRDTPWHRTGHAPLGDRKKLRVAARLPASADLLGTPSRHP